MGYVLKAVLSSAQHPEYGQISRKLFPPRAQKKKPPMSETIRN